MPLIRPELYDSPRFWALKTDKARLCYTKLLLVADPFGNYYRDDFNLIAAWHRIGVKTKARVAKILADLETNGLVIFYGKNSEIYLHLPRFFQKMRHMKRIFPKFDGELDENGNPVIEESSTKAVSRRPHEEDVLGMKGSRREVKQAAPQSELTLGQPIVSLVPELDVPPPTADERTPTLHKAIYDLAIVNLAKQDINPAQSRSFTSGCLSQWSPEDVMDCFLDSVGKEDFRAFSRKLLSLRKKKGATLDPRTGRDHRGKDADGYAAGCNPYKDWGP